jgi:hypothetical protein
MSRALTLMSPGAPADAEDLEADALESMVGRATPDAVKQARRELLEALRQTAD